MTIAIIASLAFIGLVTLSVKHTLANRVKPMDEPNEFHQALAAHRQAQANFEIADPDYIDVAIADLHTAELRRDIALRHLREGR